MTTTNDAPAPAPSGSGVRVKPLEWVGDPLDDHAKTPFGRYRAEHSGYWSGPNHVDGDEDDMKSAKAAAQADYEARILSAIASDASPRGEAVAFPADGELMVMENGHRSCDFERWANRVDLPLHMAESGLGRFYADDRTEWAWHGWIAAHPALATVEMRETVEGILTKSFDVNPVFFTDEEWDDGMAKLLAALAPATEGRKG